MVCWVAKCPKFSVKRGLQLSRLCTLNCKEASLLGRNYGAFRHIECETFRDKRRALPLTTPRIQWQISGAIQIFDQALARVVIILFRFYIQCYLAFAISLSGWFPAAASADPLRTSLW